MVSQKGDETGGGKDGHPVILSQGAGVALGSVFNRLIKSKPSGAPSKVTGKRARQSNSVLLTGNEEVRERLRRKTEDKKRYKEARKAKLEFESNGRVIPDAATNAAREKEFLGTATRGAVALFNAVSKAQKAAEESAAMPKKKGPPISRNNFMDMIRAGVTKQEANAHPDGDHADSDGAEHQKETKSKAKWLKDDFLTARSRTLKDWDREGKDASASDSGEEDGISSGREEDASDVGDTEEEE